MTHRRLLGFLALAFLAASLRVAAEDANTLTFAVLPRFSELETMGQFAALMGEIKKATGKTVILKQAPDFDAHLELLRNQEVDISYQNPVVYALAADKAEVVATAVISGTEQFRGVIIVLDASPYRQVTDLRGKSVWVIDKLSASGYLSQQMQCLAEGISLEEDAKLVAPPDSKVDEIIKAVADKRADAACIREEDLKRIETILGDAKKIRVLANGVWLPQWALAVRSTLPESVKTSIKKAVISIERGHRALRGPGLDAFVEGDRAKYEPLRHLLMDKAAK